MQRACTRLGMQHTCAARLPGMHAPMQHTCAHLCGHVGALPASRRRSIRACCRCCCNRCIADVEGQLALQQRLVSGWGMWVLKVCGGAVGLTS
jgi:hypothetical protein